MSSCCSVFCASVCRHFDAAVAQGDLDRYRRKGPNPTTRLMRDAVLAAGGSGTVLDVGAGIGALSFELLDAGFTRAIVIEAATAYVTAARQEAERRNRGRQFEAAEGDFVTLSATLPQVDVVTLDRVVCCYPAYEPLLEAAASHSRRLLALSYPRSRWHVRVVVALQNLARRLARNPFRTFVHPARAMAAVLERHGFRRVDRCGTLGWCVDQYVRDAT